MKLFQIILFLVFAVCFSERSFALSSLVYDVNTGLVLYAEKAGSPWDPAAITEIMTAYIVFRELKSKRLNLKQKIKVSRFASSKPPSKLGVPAGNTITVKQALEAMIIRGANDMSVVLAEAVSGSEAQFVNEMNFVAKKLGMNGSYFMHSHGLENKKHFTTARDIGLLTRALIDDFPKLQMIFQKKYLKWGKRKLNNRNILLRKFEGGDGMKTGFNCQGGWSIVASATRKGRRLIAIVLGAPSSRYRFDVATNLLKKEFEHNLSNDGKLISLSKLSNAGTLRSPNLRHAVCAKQKVAKFVKPSQLEGWGVSFGSYKRRKWALRALHYNIASFRGIITGAQASVLARSNSVEFTGILAGLKKQQIKHLCEWMGRAGWRCDVISPQALKKIKRDYLKLPSR